MSYSKVVEVPLLGDHGLLQKLVYPECAYILSGYKSSFLQPADVTQHTKAKSLLSTETVWIPSGELEVESEKLLIVAEDLVFVAGTAYCRSSGATEESGLYGFAFLFYNYLSSGAKGWRG
jgi:hypothetical protein